MLQDQLVHSKNRNETGAIRDSQLQSSGTREPGASPTRMTLGKWGFYQVWLMVPSQVVDNFFALFFSFEISVRFLAYQRRSDAFKARPWLHRAGWRQPWLGGWFSRSASPRTFRSADELHPGS